MSCPLMLFLMLKYVAFMTVSAHMSKCVFMCVCVLSHTHTVSCVQLFATPWTAAHQAPQSMGFSRQEYWSGVPFPPPGDLPDPGIEHLSLASPDLADDAPALHHRATWETCL